MTRGGVGQKREHDGGGGGVGEVADELEGPGAKGIKQGRGEGVFAGQAVSLDEGEAGLGGEALAEEGGEAPVDLGGDDADAPGEELFGHGAGAGADFEHGVEWGEGGGVDELTDEVVVGEEVLSELVAGGEAAGFEEGLDLGEGLHGLPQAAEEMIDGEGDAVLVVVKGVALGDVADEGDGVAHGDAQAGVADHALVVDFVADGGDSGGRDAPLEGEVGDGAPFGGVGVEEFKDVEGAAFGDAAGVFGGNDGGETMDVGLAGGGEEEVGLEESEGVGEAAGADADGVLGVFVVVDVLEEADLDGHGLEPPGGDGVEGDLVWAVNDEVVVAGLRGVFEDEGGVPHGVEALDGVVNEWEADREAFEGVAKDGVGDDAPPGDDDWVGLADGAGDVAALGQASAGADDGADSGGAGGVDGHEVGVRDAALGVEQGSVEVDGEQVVFGRHAGQGRGACRGGGTW